MKLFSLLLILTILSFFAPLSASSDGPVVKISAAIKSEIDSEWKKIDKGAALLVWQYRTSPPFPAHWPQNDIDYSYVYAAGRDVERMTPDGETASAPWARIEASVSGAGQRLVVLSKKIERIGVQGVRPLRPEEARISGELADAAAIDRAEYKSQKGYYCSWIGNNGLVAKTIIPNHEAFVKWLGCR